MKKIDVLFIVFVAMFVFGVISYMVIDILAK